MTSIGTNPWQGSWRGCEIEIGGTPFAIVNNIQRILARLQALNKDFSIVAHYRDIIVTEECSASGRERFALGIMYHNNRTVYLFHREACGDAGKVCGFDQ